MKFTQELENHTYLQIILLHTVNFKCLMNCLSQIYTQNFKSKNDIFTAK